MAGECLIWVIKHIFPRILWFPRTQHGLSFLGPKECYTIALLHDIKLRITLFEMIQPSPCVNVLSSNNTKKRNKVLNFAMEPQPRLLTSQDSANFSAVRCLKSAWNKPLHVLFLFFDRLFLFNLILFVCHFFYKKLFFVGGVKTSYLDETDSTVFRCSVYLFILLINTRILITTYLYYWVSTYLWVR